MRIAILSDPIVVGYAQELFPNTSFPATGPNAEFLAENNAKVCLANRPHDPLTEKLVGCPPYVDGEYVYLSKVEPFTAEELELSKASSMTNIRQLRDQLLKECDWTQLADTSTALKAEWAAYRQALRDITAGIDDPRTATIVWPKKPTDVTE